MDVAADNIHVSHLCESVEGEPMTTAASLLKEFLRGKPAVQPMGLLDCRVTWQGDTPVVQGLVRWPDESVHVM